jgi:hypothetical protein
VFFSSLKTNGILHLNVLLLNRVWYMKYRICTLWKNINFICSRFGNMTKSEPFVLYLFFVRRKYINVREHRMGNRNGQSKGSGNDDEKQNKNRIQYVMNTTMRQQDMSPHIMALSSFPPAISTCWLHKQNSYQSSRELSWTCQQWAGVIT